MGAYSSVALTGTTAEPRTCFALPAGTLKELLAFFPVNTLVAPLLLEFGPVGLPAVATVSVPPGATGFFSTGPIAVPIASGGWRWHAVTAPFAGAHAVSIAAGARFKPT